MVDKLTPEVSKILDEIDSELMQVEREELKALNAVAHSFFLQRLPSLNRLRVVAKKIRGFWSTSLQNCEYTKLLINTKEREILEKYLIDIEVQPLEVYKCAYRILLHFSTNPYFTNPVLKRDVIYLEDEDTNRDINYSIDWKPNGNFLSSSENTFFSEFIDSKSELGIMILDDLFPDAVDYFRGLYNEDVDTSYDKDSDNSDDRNNDVEYYKDEDDEEEDKNDSEDDNEEDDSEDENEDDEDNEDENEDDEDSEDENNESSEDENDEGLENEDYSYEREEEYSDEDEKANKLIQLYFCKERSRRFAPMC
jgi:hypothetical protein